MIGGARSRVNTDGVLILAGAGTGNRRGRILGSSDRSMSSHVQVLPDFLAQ